MVKQSDLARFPWRSHRRLTTCNSWNWQNLGSSKVKNHLKLNIFHSVHTHVHGCLCVCLPSSLPRSLYLPRTLLVGWVTLFFILSPTSSLFRSASHSITLPHTVSFHFLPSSSLSLHWSLSCSSAESHIHNAGRSLDVPLYLPHGLNPSFHVALYPLERRHRTPLFLHLVFLTQSPTLFEHFGFPWAHLWRLYIRQTGVRKVCGDLELMWSCVPVKLWLWRGELVGPV